MVSYQKGPTRHAYAWQIGPFWQDTLDITTPYCTVHPIITLIFPLMVGLQFHLDQRSFAPLITSLWTSRKQWTCHHQQRPTQLQSVHQSKQKEAKWNGHIHHRDFSSYHQSSSKKNLKRKIISWSLRVLMQSKWKFIVMVMDNNNSSKGKYRD